MSRIADCSVWMELIPVLQNHFVHQTLSVVWTTWNAYSSVLPCLTETGIHTVINGPITYSADGAPLVGAVPGLPNAFACLGLRAGIGEGGGLGKVLAQIIVHGECEWDAWYLDPRRLTGWATIDATCRKAVEEYQREFDYHLPHEHRPAARLARSTPLYGELDRQHCHWGVVEWLGAGVVFQAVT